MKRTTVGAKTAKGKARHIPGAPGKYPPKEFANFSRTMKRYDIKFYIRLTHSIVRKFGKFQYSICGIDKTTPLLVMATFSKIVSTIQDSAKAVSANTFFE